jgi:hypothetical protein
MLLALTGLIGLQVLWAARTSRRRLRAVIRIVAKK